MTFIIRNENAWKLMCKKYNIQTEVNPPIYPIVVGFMEAEDDEPITNVIVLSIRQAAMFLSNCMPEQFNIIDTSTRDKIVKLFLKSKSITMETPEEMMEGVEEMPPAKEEKIEGLEELKDLPLDPSKFDTKQNVADLGDPTEHVLDVERSV